MSPQVPGAALVLEPELEGELPLDEAPLLPDTEPSLDPLVGELPWELELPTDEVEEGPLDEDGLVELDPEEGLPLDVELFDGELCEDCEELPELLG